MSGLVRYFRGFLTVTPDVAQNDDDDYRLSISSLASSHEENTSRRSTSQLESDEKQAPEDDRENERDMQDDTREEEKEEEQGDGEESLELVSYEAWRQERNDALSDYMMKRLVRPEEGDEEASPQEKEGNESERYEVPDNDGLDVPYWDTQQLSQPETPQESSARETSSPEQPTPSPRKPKPRIPHVDDTTHVATSIHTLDLYARELTFDLCQIDKIWPLRRTHRREWMDTSPSVGTTVPLWGDGPLPLFPYKSFEDDGPLATLFKQVISIEITQPFEAPETLELREAAAAAFPTTRKRRRLRVFFYGRYASFISSFLNGTSLNTTLLLSLQNIPAKCVLPFQAHASSWYDQEDLADHCICIGDRSGMKMDNNGAMEKVRFDREDLKVVVASLEKAKKKNSGEVAEIRITPDELHQHEIHHSDTSTLVPAYREWQSSNHLPEEEKEEESAPPVPIENDDNDHGNKRAGPDEEVTAEESQKRDGPQRKRQKTFVHYHKLNELREFYETRKQNPTILNDDANVYGAVIGFGTPKQTRRGDWMATIAIVDESLPLPHIPSTAENTTDTSAASENVEFITLNIFCKEREQLPKICIAGDVLRAHRVNVQEWHNDIQLLGKRKSSFVVFRPDGHNGWSVLPTAKHEFTFTQEDHDRASALWQWAKQRLMTHPTIKLSQRFKLSDMKRPGEADEEGDKILNGDLTAMVTAIIPNPQGLQPGFAPQGFLRVWDGTGLPASDPLPNATPEATDSIRDGDPPSEALVCIASAVRALRGEDSTGEDGSETPTRSPSTSRLEAPKCLCGRVVNVAIWEKHHWYLVSEMVHVGEFIRLRNVEDKILFNTGLRCLMVYRETSITPLPDTTYEVRILLEEHQERIAKKDPFNPQSGLLPLAGATVPPRPLDRGIGTREMSIDLRASASGQDDFGDSSKEELSNLSQCITAPSPNLFHTSFRIVRTIPNVSETEVGLRSLCISNKNGASGEEMKFQFAVHLSDGTAEIDAIVQNDVAESLLGRTADEACKSTYKAAEILHVIARQDASWNGKIRSVELNGAKYFVLESVSIAKNGLRDSAIYSLPPHTW